MNHRLPFPKTDHFVRYEHLEVVDDAEGGSGRPVFPRHCASVTIAFLCDRETREPRWFGVSLRSERDRPNGRLGKVIALGRAVVAERGRGNAMRWKSPRTPGVGFPFYGTVDEAAPRLVRGIAQEISVQAAAWRATRAG